MVVNYRQPTLHSLLKFTVMEVAIGEHGTDVNTLASAVNNSMAIEDTKGNLGAYLIKVFKNGFLCR